MKTSSNLIILPFMSWCIAHYRKLSIFRVCL